MLKGQQKAVVWFSEVTKKDIATVGGKGANLGEMTNANIPVPPGFIVTANAYYDFLQSSKITGKIRHQLEPLDVSDSKQLQQTSTEVKQLILNAAMPPELAKEIKKAYIEMGGGLVAVRSSATAEDLPEASFAGQQSTFLNVQGEEEVVNAVQGCWASLFEARAIFYRQQQGFDHFKVGIAVPVQKMVQSEASGVMFTIEPVTSDTGKIIIEAIYGLGEALVSGEVNPDLYIVDKEGLKISSKKMSRQDRQLIRNLTADDKDTNIWAPVDASNQALQKLTDDNITKLAKLGKQIEDHYQFPQDIEWAKEDKKIFIVQTRPVTTIKETTEVEPEIKAPVLLSGAAASPGIASGPVKIIPDASQIDRVQDGDILVAEMTTPDFVPAMKRAVAIVTNRGGRTAHAAIVSRELGIPCIVGVERATTTLANGQIITVDGLQGKIYEGKVTRRIKTAFISNILKEAIKTRTKVYVNLAQPELADKVAAHDVDGVGLLRAEFMVAQIGEHPSYMISQNRGQEFVDKLANGINTFTKAFNPRPVVYRTNDFKTNEYRELTGGQEYEEVEENPMLGYRGASRYIIDIDVFKLEIEAIKKVRQNYRNLWVMIPFVRTVDEMARTIEILESQGLKRSADFKLWMMVEVPSNIFLLEKFLELGIDGISIGSNDLTQLILGIDRDSEKLASTFDERDEAVLIALERAVKVSKSMGVTSSICGQAPSVYPELTEKLVEWGITSVSVSPDMIGVTREIIAKAEEKLRLHGQSA
ncbi:MAG: phosphoenolpyruvate synthase [Dehalococcoidia bacterium]|nr:MAG: phosphoenolpyruvate synthase [Dehalococcoidia bacterium]